MMKISALLEMTLPQMTLTDDSTLLANESSLYHSLNEEEYRTHGLQNRYWAAYVGNCIEKTLSIAGTL
jgi:hypothetical protein